MDENIELEVIGGAKQDRGRSSGEKIARLVGHDARGLPWAMSAEEAIELMWKGVSFYVRTSAGRVQLIVLRVQGIEELGLEDGSDLIEALLKP